MVAMEVWCQLPKMKTTIHLMSVESTAPDGRPGVTGIESVKSVPKQSFR
jgi:hypothetical protein